MWPFELERNVAHRRQIIDRIVHIKVFYLHNYTVTFSPSTRVYQKYQSQWRIFVKVVIGMCEVGAGKDVTYAVNNIDSIRGCASPLQL